MNRRSTCRSFLRVAALLMLAPAVLASRASAVTVTLDQTKADQTIEGFGAYGACIKAWQPACSAELARRMVHDLGLTISRGPLPFDFLQPDGRFNYSGDVSRWMPVWKTLQKQGIRKFIISVWSPPVWMKTPGNHGHKESWCADGRCGGQLPPENDGRFAAMCVEFLRYFKKEVGVDVYGLSIQNEPAFDQPFESCVYTPAQYVTLLKAVGERIEQAGLTTRLFGPEDIGSPDRVMQYMNAIMDDPQARRYVGFSAVHGYAPDGVTADSPDARIWQGMFDAGAAHDKQLWMTETSGYGQSWVSGLALGKAIYTAMRFGHVSAWCWWQAAIADQPVPTDQTLMAGEDGAVASPEYYVLRNFARFVRPGAVRIEVEADDPAVLPLAFKQTGDKTFTLVLINQSDQEQPVRLNGANGLSAWRAWRTSEGENCADAGGASAGQISLPPRSITTLQCAIGAN